MRKVRGVVAILLMLVFLFTSCWTNIYAAEAGDTAESEELAAEASETVETVDYGAYDEAIRTLMRFGILDEEAFDPAAKVTRGDFIAKAMKITGIGDMLTPVDTDFSDVKKDNPNSGAIAAAASMGVVKGFGDGTFGPDITLTKEQSAKILVSILGYEVYANAYGGYPGGYLSIASMQGLLKKIEIGDYQECAWDAAAQLIFNAMDADVLQVEKYPENKYFSNEGENPMTLWMGIYLHEGVITASDVTSLDVVDGVKEGMLKIDDQMYYENNTGASNYLGYPVKAYYSLDNNENRTLMSIKIKSTVSEVYSDATEIDGKTTTTNFYWYENGKNSPSNQAIAGDAKVFYNGKRDLQPLTAALLQPNIGGVRLIDTTNDNKADLVYIDDAKVYVVKTITVGTRTVKDKYDQPTLSLDPKDTDLVVNLMKDGEAIEFDEIKVNNVLTVTQSRDGKLCSIVVCSDKIKGAVEEKSNDSIIVDGTEYKVVKANIAEFNKLNVGDKTTFYFTANEQIAGYGVATSTGTNYGYLIIGSIGLKGVDKGNDVTLRIFGTDDAVKEYKIVDDISLNNSRTDESGVIYTPATVLNKLAVVSPEAPRAGDTLQRIFCNQLIKFTVNADEKITEIELPADNRIKSGGTGEYVDDFSYDYSYHTRGTDYTYYKNFGFIAGRYNASGAVCMKIPDATAWESFYNGGMTLENIEKQICVFSTSSDWYNDYKIYNIDIYDTTEAKTCGVILEQANGGSSAVPGLELFAVEKVVNAIDDDGYPVKKLYGGYKGTYGGYTLDEESIKDAQAAMHNADADVVLDLKPGDVLRVSINGLGEVTNLIKIFTMDSARRGYFLNSKQYDDWFNARAENSADLANYKHTSSASDWNQIHNIIHAKYSEVVGTTLNISLGFAQGSEDSPLGTRLLTTNSKSKFYVYDEENETVKVGSIDDIDPDDPRQTVVIRNRYYENYEGVIINRKADPGTIYWVGPYNE